ncbi:hypothetical protein COLO4_01436, partial [Corchorus olitorius]
PAGRDRHPAQPLRPAGLAGTGRRLGARRDRLARMHEGPGRAAGHGRGRAARPPGQHRDRSRLRRLRGGRPGPRHGGAGGQRRHRLRHTPCAGAPWPGPSA